MANDLAIATVTETLVRRIERLFKENTGEPPAAAITGVTVDAKRPGGTTPDSGNRISVYLYRISPNAALRNRDLPTRNAEGQVVQRPTAALDLHYLLSFSGDDGQLVPQRMLGRVVASLHSQPALSRAEIEAASDGEPWLSASNLKDEIERVTFCVASLTVDELSKLWSTFPQVPNQLSVAYDASVVLIESEVTPREPLPVRQPGVDTIPALPPVIDAINGGAPVTGDAPLRIVLTGRHLRGPVTLVQFDDLAPQTVTPERDTRLVVPDAITGTLGAGIHTVRVLHEILLGEQQVPHRAMESNTVAFMLRPAIAVAQAANIITVTFTPPLRAGQRLQLLLSELLDEPPEDRPLRSLTLEPASVPGPTQRTFDAIGVPAGTYLVRAQVDNAESLATVVSDDGVPRPAPTVTRP